MNIFKPTRAKIILLAIFLLITVVVHKPSCSQGLGDQPECIWVTGLGYPMFFGEQLQGDVIIPLSFDFGIFLINIVIYYIIASLIVSVWKRKTK